VERLSVWSAHSTATECFGVHEQDVTVHVEVTRLDKIIKSWYISIVRRNDECLDSASKQFAER
jgi:hypothetical protein